ncbi:endothelial differentiation-related factor 1 homolog [Drosophila pseudoobscura]|uniref:Endothelial differentiation-related factor 1 homolog n=1 Tax=Drosophila pseudoobscura pseudoobscura TaxID=46245 RepID=A0A6I8V2P2_DROPS|nr:endothelial differentiation-related factor 1 homolog [Drosophila pseudoobscura]
MSSTNLDYEHMSQRREKLPQDVCRLIMQGRQAKGLSQKDLASKICEKPQVIGDYEAGRGIPKDQILAKIERIIGIKLRGKNRGMPLETMGKKK